jgi:hypothetical protein
LKHRGFKAVILMGVTCQLLIPSTVFAATVTEGQYQQKPTIISVSGHSPFEATHIIARDPWSGNETTWISISVVQRALKDVGFETTWKGTEFALVKYPPGYGLRDLGGPEAGPATINQIAFHLVAGAPPSAVMPMLTDNATKYMPIYYVDTILNHYWRTNAKWNGTTNTWSFDFKPILVE